MNYSRSRFVRRLRTRVLPNVGSLLLLSRTRRCGCCNRTSLILNFGGLTICARCGANRRQEVLATFLRDNYDLQKKDVLELDPGSALRTLLRRAKTYTRSYYDANHSPGARRRDGSVMQDITKLTLPTESLDLIVSSDVLEHVPDVSAAFRESFRVLRAGGAHVFTVPMEAETVRRAMISDGQILHLVTPPEYHLDPLNPAGILAFWHFGTDLQERFGDCGLIFTLTRVSPGRRGEVWEARKPI